MSSQRRATPLVHDLESLRASTAAVISRVEAAAVLGVDPRSVAQAIQNGDLPAVRIGSRMFIKRVPFLRMLTEEQNENDESHDRDSSL